MQPQKNPPGAQQGVEKRLHFLKSCLLGDCFLSSGGWLLLRGDRAFAFPSLGMLE